MRDRFYGRLVVRQASALFRFQKQGLEQRLLHAVKYQGREDLAAYLGNWMGIELKFSGHFQDIDLVVPVPQHWRKRLIRGYNQVSPFARALARELNARFSSKALVRRRHGTSLVGAKRIARGTRVNPFAVARPELIRDRHILLVDDLMTTGMTLEQCGTLIHRSGSASISLATIAMA
jgi:predicted amidophosphoribosyltransferase